jgi:cobalamin biosynthesis Mg chelatase CobN
MVTSHDRPERLAPSRQGARSKNRATSRPLANALRSQVEPPSIGANETELVLKREIEMNSRSGGVGIIGVIVIVVVILFLVGVIKL